MRGGCDCRCSGQNEFEACAAALAVEQGDAAFAGATAVRTRHGAAQLGAQAGGPGVAGTRRGSRLDAVDRHFGSAASGVETDDPDRFVIQFADQELAAGRSIWAFDDQRLQ